jgi:hypothetical protein
MTEAERTRLPHPTPVHILMAIGDAADAYDREHGTSLAAHVVLIARRGVKQANEEFHNERV